MPYTDAYMKVRVWVPPGRPSFPGEPGQPLPPEVGWPGLPEQPEPPEIGWPLPPSIGGGPVLPPGFPEYPGQPLPRPPRPVYPVVDDPDDLGGHGELPDLNHSRRSRITDGTNQFTAYIVDPEPPQVEDDYEPRWPSKGRPGSWHAVLVGSGLAWAWAPDVDPGPGEPGAPDQGGPGAPEREPKAY
jgi:hypothetical protein